MLIFFFTPRKGVSLRRVALIVTLPVMMLLAACGEEQASQEEQQRRTEIVEETIFETVEVTEEVTQEETEAPGTPVETTDVPCSGFGSQMQAQQFFDANATEAERRALDTDGNGLACDEPRNEGRSGASNPQEAELYAQLDQIPLDSEPRPHLEFGRDVSEEIMMFESCVFDQSTPEQVAETRDMGVGSFERVRALYEQGACVEEFNLMADAAERDIYISVLEAQQYLGSL